MLQIEHLQINTYRVDNNKKNRYNIYDNKIIYINLKAII